MPIGGGTEQHFRKRTQVAVKGFRIANPHPDQPVASPDAGGNGALDGRAQSRIYVTWREPEACRRCSIDDYFLLWKAQDNTVKNINETRN